ncbi:MAG: hypothetical protein VB137_07610 [Burkholderia sp.]
MKEQAIHGRLFNNVERFVLPPSRSRTDTIANGVSKNWASSPPRSPSGNALDTCRLIEKLRLNNRIRYTSC